MTIVYDISVNSVKGNAMTKLIFPAVLLCLLVVGCGIFDDLPASDIKYEVTGTASSVNITINNAQGNVEEFSNVSIPWTKEFFVKGYVRDPDYDTEDKKGYSYTAYISARSNSNTGSVTVKIYADGKENQAATSNGSYVTATASKKFLRTEMR